MRDDFVIDVYLIATVVMLATEHPVAGTVLGAMSLLHLVFGGE